MDHLPTWQAEIGPTEATRSRLWHVGPPESEIHFVLRHLVVSEINGRIGRWRAMLLLDLDEPALSTLDVVIDAASLETGAPERDAHIRSAEFLHAGAFPEIRFRSRDIVSLGQRRYEVTGDLTIREITRDVTLTVEELRPRPPAPSHQPQLAFVAHATINRQEFGLHWNQDLDSGGVIVADKIDVTVTVASPRPTRP